MILSVHQPQFLPWLGFFDKLAKSDVFVFLDQVQYKPREWQNRNKIRTKDGSLWLTVPTVHVGGRQKICDVRIDNSTDWAGKHWKSLCIWYSRAQYFDKYKSFFEKVYQKKWEFLIDLNVHLTTYLLEQLNISIPIYFESRVGTSKQSTERIIEIAQKLGTDNYFTGIGGKNYLDEPLFDEAGIALTYQEYEHPVYRQLHGDDQGSFVSNLSVIDLLFNEGENSSQYFNKKAENHV